MDSFCDAGRWVSRIERLHIKRVPPALSNADSLTCIKEQERLPASKVERIHKIQNKVKVPTLTVLIDFSLGAVSPARLHNIIGFLTFKTLDYVLPPSRCFCCLGLSTWPGFVGKASDVASALANTNIKRKPKCAACGRPRPAMSEVHVDQDRDHHQRQAGHDV